MTGEPRLSLSTLGAVRAKTPGYAVEAVRIGVVHLGPGAFFRAHQAPVYERLLAEGDDRWGVCGVSSRSPDVRDALEPQDGLYTLVRLGDAQPPQVVGALRELIVAPEHPVRVLARLAAPQTRVVSLTVTEKGYHLDADGELDLARPEVARDLAAPEDGSFATAVGWLAAGLRARRDAGAAPFLTLSCDNVSGNGAKLKRSALAFVRARGEAELAAWIEGEAAFPDGMVDSITPATDDALRVRVRELTGAEDAWPIQREPFTQWVVEDVGHPALAELARAGVTLTRDVAGYERAKLRLLNGAHSTLAYIGLLAGFETVSEAMGDPRLSRFVEQLMRERLAPTVRPPEGLDVSGYIDAILERFRNPQIRHRLAQIASDGSQKLPIRLLAPATEALQEAAPVTPFAVPLAAWMRSVVRTHRSGDVLCDPRAEGLLRIAAACSGQDAEDVERFLDEAGVVPKPLREHGEFRDAVARSYLVLAPPDPLASLDRLMAWRGGPARAD